MNERLPRVVCQFSCEPTTSWTEIPVSAWLQRAMMIGLVLGADRISQAFTDAVAAAGIVGEHCPTFHELRSLCKREYLKQGNVDTKSLLGHAGERVADKYADPRGIEPVKVSIG